MNRFFQKFGSDHKLGLRIVKTGLAVTVCIVISNLLKLDDPFLAVIATVLSMGKSVDVSVRSAKNKLIGVAMGSALGCGFAMISGANPGLCGVGIIILLYLCQVFHLFGASTLSCFAFAAVMFAKASPKPWLSALTCAENALIGIAVAVIVNLVVFPPNYAEEVKRSYALLREKTDFAIQDAVEKRDLDVKEISNLIERLASNIRLYVSEAKMLRGDDDAIFAISCKVATYRMILDELKAVDGMELEGKEQIPESLQVVYTYHMERMRRLHEDVLAVEKKMKKK